MPISAYAFFELCRSLIRDPNYQTEAGHRTVVGRAYYSAFHAVKEKLERAGMRFPETGKVHGDVIKAAKKQNSMVGNQLDQLFEDRKSADYDLRESVTREMANNSFKLAELVHNQIGLLGR